MATPNFKFPSPGWNSPRNHIKILARGWAGQNFSLGWNSPCNQLLSWYDCDGDGNENVEEIGLVRKISTLNVHHIFGTFFGILPRLRRDMSLLCLWRMEDTRYRIFLSLLNLELILRIRPYENSPTIDKYSGRIGMKFTTTRIHFFIVIGDLDALFCFEPGRHI